MKVPDARADCEIAGVIVALQTIAPPGSTKFGLQVPWIGAIPDMLTVICGVIIGYGLVLDRRAASFERDEEDPRTRSWQYAPDWNEHDDGTMPDGAKTKRYRAAMTTTAIRNAQP